MGDGEARTSCSGYLNPGSTVAASPGTAATNALAAGAGQCTARDPRSGTYVVVGFGS